MNSMASTKSNSENNFYTDKSINMIRTNTFTIKNNDNKQVSFFMQKNLNIKQTFITFKNFLRLNRL